MAEPGEDLKDFECSLKKKTEYFSLSIVPRALAISFLISVFFFIGIHGRSFCGEESRYSTITMPLSHDVTK